MPNTTDLTAALVETKAALDAGIELRNITTRTLALYRLFDTCAELGYAMVTLLEHATPGATSALVSWCEAQGIEHAERTITPPGVSPASVVSAVTRPTKDGPGARISVQRTLEVVS